MAVDKSICYMTKLTCLDPSSPPPTGLSLHLMQFFELEQTTLEHGQNSIISAWRRYATVTFAPEITTGKAPEILFVSMYLWAFHLNVRPLFFTFSSPQTLYGKRGGGRWAEAMEGLLRGRRVEDGGNAEGWRVGDDGSASETLPTHPQAASGGDTGMCVCLCS